MSSSNSWYSTEGKIILTPIQINIGSTLISYTREAGRGSPRRKEVNKASELLGLKQGTACPAPLNVANVRPSYS